MIKGHFYVVGHSPDADSIKFKANSKTRWQKINTEHREKFEENLAAENGIVMLRLQGIDALETHYSPKPLPKPKGLKQKGTKDLKKPAPGDHEQPAYLGKLATAELLGLLGFKKAEWRSWGKRTWVSKATIEKRGKEVCIEEKYKDKIPGYIVTRDVEKNGRPLAWVFPGSTRTRDGTRLTQEKLASRIEQSANYQLLRQGLVYPYFFMTLPAKLRDKLAEATQEAQAEAAQQAQSSEKPTNIWLYDQTVKGLSLTNLDKITEEYEIYPYLFRKVLKHWYRKNMERYWAALPDGSDSGQTEDHRKVSLKGFFETGNPYIFIVSERDFVKLDQIVEIKRNRLKMTKYPFDIVFLS